MEDEAFETFVIKFIKRFILLIVFVVLVMFITIVWGIVSIVQAVNH